MPELLTLILENHFNVNGMGEGWLGSLQRTLNHPRFPNRATQFKQELAEAILHQTVTPAQYERLTGAAYDTPEEVEGFLREVWQHLYGDEPVTLSKDDKVIMRA